MLFSVFLHIIYSIQLFFPLFIGFVAHVLVIAEDHNSRVSTHVLYLQLRKFMSLLINPFSD